MQVARTAAGEPLPVRVHAALDALLLPSNHSSPPQHLAIALSGGADSLALTLLAAEYANRHGITLHALTVDHRLRAESTQEVTRVAGWMRERGIRHEILTPEHLPTSRNLQARARSWRYDALAKYCRTHGILHCLIAHHAGDNRETLLHHETRDAESDAHSGMAQVRLHHGVRFLRPMLQLERDDIEAFLAAQNTNFIHDPSNQNHRFARVRHRAQLREDSTTRDRLDAELLTLATARRAQEERLADAAMRCVTLHPFGAAEISLQHLRALTPTLAQQLLADTLTTIGGAERRPRHHETARLIYLLMSKPRAATLAKCAITLHGETLLIAREPARVAEPLTLTGRGTARWDNRFTLHYALPPGDFTLRALGREGRAQLKHLPHTAPPFPLPLASPSLWHLDELRCVPYITPIPTGMRVRLGFTPAKPLAGLPFW